MVYYVYPTATLYTFVLALTQAIESTAIVVYRQNNTYPIINVSETNHSR